VGTALRALAHPTVAKKIEVNPELAKTGFQISPSSDVADESQEADKLLVEEMYRAMWVLQREPGLRSRSLEGPRKQLPIG
jgi:hypothetical protein